MIWTGVAVSVLMATPLSGQGYGQSVAVGDGEVIVGESLNTMAPGYVYVYRKGVGGEWTEAQRLEASNSAKGDHFGRSLAQTGNHLLVGSTTLETVYVFEKDASDAWRETQKLQASDGTEGDDIGRLAAVDGDNVLMATCAHAEGRGAVYVFHRDTSTGRWSESAKLMGSDIEPNDWFGMSLAIEGDVVLIGSPRKDGNTGAVYVFRLEETGAWTEQAKLTGAGTAVNSRFGSSVALRAGRAIIGAATHQQGVGRAFVYTFDDDSEEWEPGPTLKPFDGGTPGTQFGASVYYGQDEVWFGAPGASGFEGRIYAMTRDATDEWTNATKMSAGELDGGDQFGGTFAVSGDVAVVGVVGDDYGLGTATIFERTDDGWSEAANVFSEPISFER